MNIIGGNLNTDDSMEETETYRPTKAISMERESVLPWGAPSCRQSFVPPSCSSGPLCMALWDYSTWRPVWHRSSAALCSGCGATGPKLCTHSLDRYALDRHRWRLVRDINLFILLNLYFFLGNSTFNFSKICSHVAGFCRVLMIDEERVERRTASYRVSIEETLYQNHLQF